MRNQKPGNVLTREWFLSIKISNQDILQDVSDMQNKNIR